MTSLCIGDSHINRFKAFVGKSLSSNVYNISSLQDVQYYGVSGGRVSKKEHLTLFHSAIHRFRPSHVIVVIGGNDLDSAEPDFDMNCVVFRLVTFLTQIKNFYHLRSVTVLSIFHRTCTRHVSLETFHQRLQMANQILKEQCLIHSITHWKLRWFAASRKPILCDGVHLNTLGQYKLLRQLHGVFLHHLWLFLVSYEDRGFWLW